MSPAQSRGTIFYHVIMSNARRAEQHSFGDDAQSAPR
jgi:hypothetical protein